MEQKVDRDGAIERGRRKQTSPELKNALAEIASFLLL
jgi:hypothetical protein